jgi:hypothetical protein
VVATTRRLRRRTPDGKPFGVFPFKYFLYFVTFTVVLTYNRIYKIETMGQLVIIRLKAKDDKSITAVNKLLKKAGIKNSFITEEDNIAWIQDINNNPKSPQAHLRPLTVKQLKYIFGIWCEVGALHFDVAFSRTSQALAKRYAKFILKHADLIDQLQGANELIERYKLSKEEQEVIKRLNTIVHKCPNYSA